MELCAIEQPKHWLDELLSTPPVSTGWVEQIKNERDVELALDWPPS